MVDGKARGTSVVPPWRLHLGRGLRCLAEGRLKKAGEHFELARLAAPDEPEVLLALGHEHLRRGRAEDALPLLEEAHRRMPGNAAAAASLARLLGLHLRRREEAFAVLQGALERCAESGPLHVVKGELLLEDGGFVEARVAFGLAMGDETAGDSARLGMARAYNAEGIVHGDRGEFDQAVFALKHAADLERDWSAPLVNLGVVFGRMGKLQKAVAAYLEALERDPENPVAHFNLATAHHELGAREEAARVFEELLELAPDYPHARASLAAVLGELGELDRAIALLLEETEIDPRCPSCFTSLGLAYLLAGNPERGEECLRRALELSPSHANARRSLSALYRTQGRGEEARGIEGGAGPDAPLSTDRS
jgi:protein O-GlcNAc transferase